MVRCEARCENSTGVCVTVGSLSRECARTALLFTPSRHMCAWYLRMPCRAKTYMCVFWCRANWGQSGSSVASVRRGSAIRSFLLDTGLIQSICRDAQRGGAEDSCGKLLTSQMLYVYSCLNQVSRPKTRVYVKGEGR